MKSGWLHIVQDHSVSMKLLCPHKCSVTIQLALHKNLLKGNITSCQRAANTTSEATMLSLNVYLAFWRGKWKLVWVALKFYLYSVQYLHEGEETDGDRMRLI